MDTATLPNKEIPSSVNVPLPNSSATPPQSGGIKPNPQGFNSGLIPGKV